VLQKGISRGLHKTPQGRPLKIKANSSFQTKWGWSEHNKRKRNLQLNEKLNQANYNKHQHLSQTLSTMRLVSFHMFSVLQVYSQSCLLSMDIQVTKGYTLNLRSLQWVISTHTKFKKGASDRKSHTVWHMARGRKNTLVGKN